MHQPVLKGGLGSLFFLNWVEVEPLRRSFVSSVPCLGLGFKAMNLAVRVPEQQLAAPCNQ